MQTHKHRERGKMKQLKGSKLAMPPVYWQNKRAKVKKKKKKFTKDQVVTSKFK